MAGIKKRKLAILDKAEKEAPKNYEEVSDSGEQDIEELKEALDLGEGDGHSGTTIKSEIIDLNDKSKEKQEQRVDFSDQRFIDELVSKQTKKVDEDEEEDDKGGFKGKTKDEAKKMVLDAESASDDNWSADDFYSVADIIITILDTFLANMMRVYAKDTADSEYSLTDKKRKLLVKQLAAILIKYQAKFKVEFLFILSLILFYAAPVLAARRRRKRINEIERQVEEARANGTPLEDAVKMAEQQTNGEAEKRDVTEYATVVHEDNSQTLAEIMPLDLRKQKGARRKK